MPDLAPSTMTGMKDSSAVASERRLECRERAADRPRRSPIIPAASRRCISAAAIALTSLRVYSNDVYSPVRLLKPLFVACTMPGKTAQEHCRTLVVSFCSFTFPQESLETPNVLFQELCVCVFYGIFPCAALKIYMPYSQCTELQQANPNTAFQHENNGTYYRAGCPAICAREAPGTGADLKTVRVAGLPPTSQPSAPVTARLKVPSLGAVYLTP